MSITLVNPPRSSDQVYDILAHRWDHEWTLQGFGMLRTYLDAEKVLRLHVWHPHFQTPKVSLVHDHPWDFNSWLYNGLLTNQRWVERSRWTPGAKPFHYQTIQCGIGGCQKGNVMLTHLELQTIERYRAGDYYHQFAEEIHASFPSPGCVSIIQRNFMEDTEHARVFWKPEDTWVSAEPRPATKEEVDHIVGRAIADWGKP